MVSAGYGAVRWGAPRRSAPLVCPPRRRRSVAARCGVIDYVTSELNRLAEAATEILVMTAVLARASRAYCTGVRNAELEMKLAACFVEQARGRVRRLVKELDDGEFINLDHFKLQFGKRVLDTKSAVVEKATTRVFW